MMPTESSAAIRVPNCAESLCRFCSIRGRYIHGLDQVHCWKPGRAEEVRYPLPLVDHTFLPGHRIMVQIQSSWFPAYDRNPQTCVPNIFNARASDYVAAKQTIFHERARPSQVLLPIALN